jgi:hypothetical protein
MNSKTSFFLLGLLAVGVVMVVAVLFLSKADALPESEDDEKLFSTQDLSEIKSQTGGLENYGNLPNSMGAGDVGRENPFDPYK